MKPLTRFQQLKIKFHRKLKQDEISLVPLALLALAAEALWIIAPLFVWHGDTPFASIEKRSYIVAFVFLAYLFIILIKNFKASASDKPHDTKTQDKLHELENRFAGALQFLSQTHASLKGQSLVLAKLPWCLVIGSSKAGKTSLLANAGVDYILQRQFPHQDKMNLKPSEHCDWWVTRETTLIDVPSKYFATPISLKNKRPLGHAILWLSFLRLIKYHRGVNGIQNILIVLPLPEMLMHGDEKNHSHSQLRDLLYQLVDFQKIFPHRIACQLVITKCDLLPGFIEYFGESSGEELTQAWGVNLSNTPADIKPSVAFEHHFETLIKKLNEQLIWRMHQERNPVARLFIKDFPLQVERMKTVIADVIKKMASPQVNLAIQGVHLTSAIQPNYHDLPVNPHENDDSTHTIQLFKSPTHTMNAYFTKQLLSRKFSHFPRKQSPYLMRLTKAQYAAYAASAGLIGIISMHLGQDFQLGIQTAHALQNHLARFHLSLNNTQDPDEKLANILNLLNSLRNAMKEADHKARLSQALSFYSTQAQQNTNLAYQKALQTILLPEIKTYFEYYLQNPVNKNAEDIYAALKAYLMLGDTANHDAAYIEHTIGMVKPNSLASDDLKSHVRQALQSSRTPLSLDDATIQNTRYFLNALPSIKLAYVLLKQLNHHTEMSDVALTNTTSVFKNQKPIAIPQMFTAKAFSAIYSAQIITSVEEANTGNWVLGMHDATMKEANAKANLIEQLRIMYVNHYIDVWESVLTNIHLIQPTDLITMDAMVVTLMSQGSPLLSLLQTLHDNTFFDPITAVDTRLRNLGFLIEKNTESQTLLYQIFASLQSLHLYMQNILVANNTKKAAFDVASQRMLNHGVPDAIMQLRLIAAKSPEPLKTWLEKIANDTWHTLMQEAGRYLDTSWQTEVIQFYQTHLANRYPFNPNVSEEVNIEKFFQFFGGQGIMASFYNSHLDPFIDRSAPTWHWKVVENQKLALKEETLGQIKHAMQLHSIFFPNNDNKINEKYALQLRKYGGNKYGHNLTSRKHTQAFFSLNLEPFNLSDGQNDHYA